MSTVNTESFKVWAENDAAYGPVDLATLIQWIQDERVLPATFVQPQSDQRWCRAASIEALREHLPAAASLAASPSPGGESPAVALRALSVFADLSDKAREQLAALGEFLEVAPRELVVKTGDPCEAVYFILSGELRVRLIVGIVDKQDKTLCSLRDGEFFGELGMFLRSKRTADVLAETESRLFGMSLNAFHLIVHQIPDLAAPILFNIGLTMAKRIAEDNQRFYREVTSQFLWA